MPVRTAIVRRLTAIEESMKEAEDEVVSVPLKRHSTLNRRTITSIVNSEEDAAAPELIEAAREIEVEIAVVVEAAPAPEVVVEEEGPVAALVRRVTEQIQEAVEAKTEASQASATEPRRRSAARRSSRSTSPATRPTATATRRTRTSTRRRWPYAQPPPPQGQMPPPPPYPYYYAPPPPPHGWAPPHAPMTVPQGAYYPGARRRRRRRCRRRRRRQEADLRPSPLLSINIDLPSLLRVPTARPGQTQAFPEEAVVPELQYEGERRVARRGAAADDETPESRHGFVREPPPFPVRAGRAHLVHEGLGRDEGRVGLLAGLSILP